MTRIEELEELIKKYAQAYYSGNSEVEDDYFDSLVDELRVLSPDSEVLNKTGWGFEPQGRKVNHLYDLTIGSLSKIKSVENIPSKFIPDFTRLSAKLDGLSVVSYYNKGRRTLSLTRGNGKQGLDVTDKINMISPETEVLGYEFTGAVRGEVLMSISQWNKVKSDRFENDPSANPRNFSAGVLNRKELSTDLKLLDYVVYKVVADPLKVFKSGFSEEFDFKKMNDFLRQEFKIVPYRTSSVLSTSFMKDLFDDFNKTYPCDGIVLTRMDRISYEGSVVDFQEVAYKFESESTEVVVTDVDWNVTRTGRVVPRIWFDPVELSGALVRKCTGFNAEFIKDNKINRGTVIRVTRSGEVIPHILEIISNPCEVGLLPKTCPNCGASLVWKGVDLCCENENEESLIYQFITKTGAIEGAGWSLYSRLIETLSLKTFEDLVNFLKDLCDDPTKFDQLIYDKISGTVTQNKCISILRIIHNGTDPETFLVACNINGISWKSASNLTQSYPEFLIDVINQKVNYDKLWSINGFGSSLVEAIKSSESKIRKLAESVRLRTPEIKEDVSTKFKVAITGALSMKRSDFDRLLSQYGYEQSSNFKEIKYLITNNPESTSSKMKKAKDYGVEIVSEKEFSEKYFK